MELFDFQAFLCRGNGDRPLELEGEDYGWLQGCNGGPLRMPTQRIRDAQMNDLRKGLIDAGLQPSFDPFRELFIGRNPV
ncbi:hypothetical protein ACIP2Y_45175 [Streptomyces sviceus]|uniref:hypothetical protein n=1 Tax=Streptomyces sviceus TaxID=285530 RepID=UPI00380DB304